MVLTEQQMIMLCTTHQSVHDDGKHLTLCY